ncbi:MAG: hypothetical protein EOP09_05145 [Proteobacteria bacterium]|nr:MAG: hypothetical protein EOP09_05145 [Pseudomonadota bacterium]
MDTDDVVYSEPVIYQVGKLTGVDISPIVQMANYINEELDYMLDGTESPEERQRVQFSNAQPKGNPSGNIDRILRVLNELIGKVPGISNLEERLDVQDENTRHFHSYFANFNTDTGDGYIGNNFGQDLRNFRKAVEYAKTKGASTVYFGFD